MDKFDQTIKNAKQSIEPSTNFVDTTIGKIDHQQPNKSWNFRLWAPVVGGLAVVVIVFAVLTSGSNTSSSKISSSKTPKTTSTQVASATPVAGTDNSSLDNYLAGIQGSMNQENTDQNSANQNVNDSQQEITVPTD
jgi:hypothetical protein